MTQLATKPKILIAYPEMQIKKEMKEKDKRNLFSTL